MALSLYNVIVDGNAVPVRAGCPRVAINRALRRVFQHNAGSKHGLTVRDNQIPFGKTLLLTCEKVGG